MIVGILPARYASSRLPGKILADLGGKSVIQRAYEQCMKAKVLDDVIVATDHPDIEAAVIAFGGKVVMTDPNHLSGTDRCAEALSKLNYQPSHVINIQGDEPFVQIEQLELLAETLLQQKAEIATLIHPIQTIEELWNPSIVKVVQATNGHALYFSRQAIPFLRDIPKEEWLSHTTFYRHLGIYGFRADVLQSITQLKPSSLETSEMLEQLRWLEAGYQIKVGITHHQSIGIDTPEDLEKALAYLAQVNIEE